jgi:molybdopterin biosynthesis enzyme
MRLEERATAEAIGTILMHNLSDPEGRRVLKKGTRLTAEHVARLTEAGRLTVPVAVLEADDAHEDEAAVVLANALLRQHLEAAAPDGGRVNLRAQVDGLLEVDEKRLLELNMIPGITLATRRQHSVVGPNQDTDNIATIKIIPFAVPRRDLQRAVALAARQPGILELRPFSPGRRVSMLFVGEPAVHGKLHKEYQAPTETRLARLGAELVRTEDVVQEESAIAEAAARLASNSELLIIAGQTSIMDEDDTTLRGLRQAGAEVAVAGAPVEPGNMLALAYFPPTSFGAGIPILCAPGCAKGLKRNVVDIVLPRLLLGEQLSRRDIAALGLGGFLTAAERGGDTT